MTQERVWTIHVCEDHRAQDCALCGVFDVIRVVPESRVQELEGERDCARTDETKARSEAGDAKIAAWSWEQNYRLAKDYQVQAETRLEAAESRLARVEERVASLDDELSACAEAKLTVEQRVARLEEALREIESRLRPFPSHAPHYAMVQRIADRARSALTHSNEPKVNH